MSHQATSLVVSGGANNMTGTAVITSKWFDMRGCSIVDFQTTWTGTPAGSFTFETTTHPRPVFADGTANPAAIVTVETLPASFAAGNPTGSAGIFTFRFAGLGCAFIRLKYTNSSGAGPLDVDASGKA